MTEISNETIANSCPIFFTEIEQFGGAERSMISLANWLGRQGIPVHIVTYVDHCDLGKHSTLPLSVLQLHAAGSTKKRIGALKRYLQARPSGAPRMLASGYQPGLHATLAGARGFHDLMHDTPSLFGNSGNRSLGNKLRIAISNRIIGVGLRSGGATIVNSEYLRAESRRDFNVDAQIVRMGGKTTDDFRFEPRSIAGPHDELRILSVSRIENNKRIDWMLRSLAALEQATPALSDRVNWRLDLAGKGTQIAALQELARSLGIVDRVHFLGFVSDEDVETLYRRAHLFLMPAVQGYGLPALESLQRGLPVVLHRESGVSDILLDTPWATVLTGGPESLTPAIDQAIQGILTGAQIGVPLPDMPTEDGWAAVVAQLCHWV